MFYVTTMQECQQLNLNPVQFLPDLIFIISPIACNMFTSD